MCGELFLVWNKFLCTFDRLKRSNLISGKGSYILTVHQQFVLCLWLHAFMVNGSLIVKYRMINLLEPINLTVSHVSYWEPANIQCFQDSYRHGCNGTILVWQRMRGGLETQEACPGGWVKCENFRKRAHLPILRAVSAFSLGELEPTEYRALLIWIWDQLQKCYHIP